MKRVLHCVASLSVGGVETRLLDALDHWTRTGSRYSHGLCAFKGGELANVRIPTLRQRNMECDVLNRPSRVSLKFWRSWLETIAKHQPVIIHAYNPTPALWARLAVRRHGFPRVIVHCGGVSGLWWSWRQLERALALRTAGFIFNSQATQAVWQSFMRVRCPSRIIYSGVRFDDGRKSSQPEHSPFVLLTVCRIVPVKNLDVQLDCMRILHERGHKDVHLIVVGDGPARASLESRVREWGMDHAVRFVGMQADPRTLHGRAHVYLCTSYNEGLSMSLAAAMADRMVCVASYVGGSSEMIEHERNGYLIPCSEPVPLRHRGRLPMGQTLPTTVFDGRMGALRAPMGISAECLADRIIAIRDGYDTLDGLRDEARKRILERFHVDRYCRDVESFYDGVLDSNR